MGDKKPDGQQRPQSPRTPAFPRLSMFLLMTVGLAFLLSGLKQPESVRIDINEFYGLVESGDIAVLTISGNSMSGERADGVPVTPKFTLENGNAFSKKNRSS